MTIVRVGGSPCLQLHSPYVKHLGGMMAYEKCNADGHTIALFVY